MSFSEGGECQTQSQLGVICESKKGLFDSDKQLALVY